MNPVVVDANLTLALILPLPYSQLAAQQFERWKSDRVALYAPDLWSYEVTSGLRKAIFHRAIASDVAVEGLRLLWALNIILVPSDVGLMFGALRWADRLGQRVAYDATYLALAERLDAEFWTADSALAHHLSQIGVTWARSLKAEDAGV